MVLTRIEYLAADSVAVYIDGEKAAVLDAADISLLGLSADTEIDSATLSEIRARARRFNARRRAFASLARADFSKKGLAKRLLEKGVDKKSAEEAAAYMESRGYVSDGAFAKRIVQAYGAEKYYGPRRVEQELWKRGIPKETAEEALAELPPEEELLAKLFEQRYARQELSDPKVRKHVFDALIRYGYSFDAVRRELSRRTAADDFEE